MPGILAAFGVPEARDLVERGARPLLRRPWQSLDARELPGGAGAIAFAGSLGGLAEDDATGVVVALDGELYGDGGIETGERAARVLLSAYAAAGQGLAPPQGRFAAAVWDPRDETLTLVTDRCGERPLYVARHRGGTLVAGELKAVVAMGVPPALDIRTWAELLAYEHALSDHTPLAGVRLLPGATVTTLGRDGSERRRSWWHYREEPAAHGDEPELVAELGRLLGVAVRRRLEPGTALALSGGLDSRSLATVVRRLAPETPAATYGAHGSADLRLGAEIARRAGLRHLPLPLAPGYIAAGAAETVWLSEGLIRCFHSHHLALRALRTENDCHAVLIGYAGDNVVRGGSVPEAPPERLIDVMHARRSRFVDDALAERVLQPDFAAQLRGLARQSFAEAFGAEDGELPEQIGHFVYRHPYPRKIWPGAELFLDDVAARDPYDDVDLVDFCRRMPRHLRHEGRLQRAYLRGFPELAALPTPKDGPPPAYQGLHRSLALTRLRASARRRRLVDAHLGPRWLPDHRGLGDYATDLRTKGGAELLGILTEERTLARGQLRAEPVRMLVRDTLAGRARNTGALGMLLTLELFQRLFLDQDAPPAALVGTAELERIA